MAQSIREKAKIRQNREEDRSTEDDIARARLGPRGQEGKPESYYFPPQLNNVDTKLAYEHHFGALNI